VSFDLSQFHQVFFDEAAEHLGTLESVLLGLDVAAPDAEALNAIFRAAHSIKGGAGTFGFSDVAEFTHVAETLLDRLRKREVALTRAMVDALLEATDVVRSLLLAHQTGGSADPQAVASVKARLEALTVDGEPLPPEPRSEVCSTARHRLRVRFSAPPDAPGVENLLAELRTLGDLEIVKKGRARRRGRSTAPARWELLLATAADEREVREVCAFVVAPEDITVETVLTEAAARDAALQPEVGASTSSVQGSGTAGGDGGDFGFFDPPAADVGDSGATATGKGVEDTSAARGSTGGQRATDRAEFGAGRPGRRDSDRGSGAVETASIRVSTEKVDQLINLVGELVITQSMLAQAAGGADARLQATLLQGLAALERNSRDLQEAVMSIRMMPVGFVFNRFPRVVRDLAARLGKRVELVTIGEQTELDKGVIEKLADPLTHLVRNALDHGIETPEERVANGKPETGTLTLRAFHQGGNIVIEVRDDGRGMDRARILAKARERGMAVADSMSDSEVFALIFEAGFSTAATVTDVSGRGVGMDVVRKNIEALGGRVEIASTSGCGSCISIRLPLTLAILDGLSVAVGDQLFIVPLSFIVESLQPRATDIRTVGGAGVVMHVRGEYLPVLRLQEAMGLRPTGVRFEDGIMVILEAEGQRIALFVDGLLGQHQVVIKSLEGNYRKVRGISAATIMGDGTVAMIVDAAELVARAARSAALPRAA
jgi:two-component system chemotaxis sensor kinase CheA